MIEETIETVECENQTEVLAQVNITSSVPPGIWVGTV